MKKHVYFSCGMSFMAAIILFLSSCSKTFYQVYDVKSDNMSLKDNSLVYENEDCRVMYNLWSESGVVSFVFSNKTDKDIFVNLGQTFFIVNGRANDYYVGAMETVQNGMRLATSYEAGLLDLFNAGLWSNDLYSYSKVRKSSKEVVSNKEISVKEPEIVCVPAHSYKIFCKYSISPSCMLVCTKAVDFPKKSAKVKDYTSDTTPLRIANRIAYGFDKGSVADKHIENDFWVSGITNYSKKAILEKEKVKTGCYSESTEKVYRFKIGGPDKFYVVYSNKMR